MIGGGAGGRVGRSMKKRSEGRMLPAASFSAWPSATTTWPRVDDAPLPLTVTRQVWVGQFTVRLSAGAVTFKTGTGTAIFTVVPSLVLAPEACVTVRS